MLCHYVNKSKEIVSISCAVWAQRTNVADRKKRHTKTDRQTERERQTDTQRQTQTQTDKQRQTDKHTETERQHGMVTWIAIGKIACQQRHLKTIDKSVIKVRNALIRQFLNNFSNFGVTLLTMPQKFYFYKILMHALVTLHKAWKCPAYHIRVLQFYCWPGVILTSAHYNRDITV